MSLTPVAAGPVSAEERSKSSPFPIIEVSSVLVDMAGKVDVDVWFEGDKVLALRLATHEALAIAESMIHAAAAAGRANRGPVPGSLQ